jgi:hypothetical protein
MPLVHFRPTKARLVIEDQRDSVLVMKVVLDGDDAVELATGGTLSSLPGVLRIRERREPRDDRKPIGSIVYVAEEAPEGEPSAAKFQVNVAMSSEKFAVLLRAANAGRLPAKFIVDAGGGDARGELPALGYRVRSGARMKVWDNHAHRSLPVANFVMILPIDVPSAPPGAEGAVASAPEAAATNVQVAELMDDMLVFQSDTRNAMFGLVSILAILAVAALAIGLAVFFR